MSKAKIPQKNPCKIDVEGGKTYYWCTCGESATQPLCDGSHRTKKPDFKSCAFTPEKSGPLFLCGCKQTRTPPYCDGAHKDISE